jgi:hypothetical protein
MIVGEGPGLGEKIYPIPKFRVVYLGWKSMHKQGWLALEYTFLGGYAKIPNMGSRGIAVKS